MKSLAQALEKFSLQDMCKRPLGKKSVAGLYAMSLDKIFKRGVLARSVYKISIYKISSLGKTLQAISLEEITEDLCGGSQRKICFQALCRICLSKIANLHQVSVQDL